MGKINEDKQITPEIIERGLHDDDCDVRAAAINACQGREVPMEIIERWLSDGDWDVRVAAMNACKGREVPIEIIERGLSDGDWRVRVAAINACQGREVPMIRTFEPPEKVYKKCISGVIVIAEIPKDAQVRGNRGEKCRANKARIIEIEGDFLGEKIGISLYDNLTSYRIGDEIVVDDFDMGFEKCAAGFHFFCSKDEAMRYRA